MKRGFVFPGVHGEPIEKKPGIYQGVPAAEYFRWNAISNSSMGHAVLDLNPLTISMAHYRVQQPIEETPEIRFGKFVHASRFEFMTALKDYVTVPDLIANDIDKEGNLFPSPCRTKEKKKYSAGEPVPAGWVVEVTGDAGDGLLWKLTESKTSDMYQDRLARFHALHAGKSFVSQAEYERQAEFLYALDSDEGAKTYFANHGPATDYELSIVWKDRETGLLCKGRIDCAQHSPIEIGAGRQSRAVIDLKSLDKLIQFPNSMAKFGYHRQGAFYADGMKAITGCEYWPCVVPAERDKPFTVGARQMEFSTVLAGRLQYRKILAEIAKSIEADTWAGPSLPPTWQVPPWALPDTLIG